MKTSILRYSGCAAILGSSLAFVSCGTPGKPPGRPGKAHQRFEAHDTNRDGKLSYSEFLQTSLAKKSANPRTTFNTIDTNDDEYVSPGELVDYRRKMKGL